MGSSNTSKLIMVLMVSLFITSIINAQFPVMLLSDSFESNPVPQPAPMGLSAKLLYPNVGRAAFVLNGSQVEIMIRGPNNISTWDFTIFREYRSYSLSYDTPSYNLSRGIWHVNITIPTTAAWDLYDLQVTVSDGVNQVNLEEWNAIQVRHSFSGNFTIFHVSDTHFFPTPGSPVNKLLAAQHQAAMANADLIINTGDLTSSGDIASLINIRETMRQSRVPYFILPGNHERDYTGTYMNYKSFFYTDYYTGNIGPDILIIMANGHQPTAPNYRLNTTQLGWIERDLAASSAKTKIVCSHAPLMEPDEDAFFLYGPDASELLRIADEQNMTAYLAGHRHNDRVDLIDDTYFIGTTSLGGSVWLDPADPGHHRNGLRVLQFTNYNLTSWSWTNWNWSQPWDEVRLNRAPKTFRTQDKGGYFSIINNLSTPLIDQYVDFLLEPLSGPIVYKVSGATVVDTVNGTTSWYVRLRVDIPVDGVAIVRVFTSNAQPPVINDIDYPNPGLVGTLTQIIVTTTNPVSGVSQAQLNLSVNGGPYQIRPMSKIGEEQFRFIQVYGTRTTLEFKVSAYDYSGQSTESSWLNLVVTSQPSPPILADPGLSSETGNISLTWSTSIDDDGTITHYTVQASDVTDFGNIIREENATATTTTLYALTNGTYYFRVQSVDNDNAMSNWSNLQNTTVAIPPIIPTTPPPPPINLGLIGIIVGAIAVIVIVVVAVYFLRFRGSKPE